jgi:hypothetical protein
VDVHEWELGQIAVAVGRTTGAAIREILWLCSSFNLATVLAVEYEWKHRRFGLPRLKHVDVVRADLVPVSS